VTHGGGATHFAISAPREDKAVVGEAYSVVLAARDLGHQSRAQALQHEGGRLVHNLGPGPRQLAV
jgi:hypothetical protein